MLLRKIFALILLLCAFSVCFAQDVIIFMGAPGSGKGTQAELLSDSLHIPHISVGDTLRSATKSDPSLDLEIKRYLNAGKMVPDHIVDQILLARLKQKDCKHGFILDGAIRSMADIPQTDAILDQIGARISAVIYLDVDEQILIDRLSGRRVCDNCGQNYHIIYAPPKIAAQCDHCHANLIQRKDDVPKVISQRISEFNIESKPLLEYYQDKNVLYIVDGSGNPSEIAAKIALIVNNASTSK